MGRKPYKNLNLPQGMRKKKMRSGKIYFYLEIANRKELPLGSDYALALKKWAELTINNKPVHQEIITFKYVAEQYIRRILPTKAHRTQKENIKELKKLYEFFNDPPVLLEAIQPFHIRQYLDWRNCVSANREKALFSHIWNWARQWGYTNKENPCRGVQGFKETGRDVYIEDDVFAKVYNAACQPIKDLMDLCYLLAQRVNDVLSLRETDIRDGKIETVARKTNKKLRIIITPSVQEVIDRILLRKSNYKVRSLYLIVNEDGQPLTYSTANRRFLIARKAAGFNTIEFQLRDLRAKASTDKEESTENIRKSQKLLGHKNITMTEHYTRNRKGETVEPTK